VSCRPPPVPVASLGLSLFLLTSVACGDPPAGGSGSVDAPGAGVAPDSIKRGAVTLPAPLSRLTPGGRDTLRPETVLGGALRESDVFSFVGDVAARGDGVLAVLVLHTQPDRSDAGETVLDTVCFVIVDSLLEMGTTVATLPAPPLVHREDLILDRTEGVWPPRPLLATGAGSPASSVSRTPRPASGPSRRPRWSPPASTRTGCTS